MRGRRLLCGLGVAVSPFEVEGRRSLMGSSVTTHAQHVRMAELRFASCHI